MLFADLGIGVLIGLGAGVVVLGAIVLIAFAGWMDSGSH